MDPDESPLIHEKRGPIATLTLNRPERMNAVSLPLYRALEAALQSLAADDAVRAAVITGAGRAFCVGADLKAHGEADLTPDERRTYVETGQRVYRLIQTLPKPVVAAVNGHAIGAGLEMALSCDFVIAASEAKFRIPELALGTFVGGGTTYTLAEFVGAAKARELIMLGDFFSGEEAAKMGLANQAVPAPEVLQTALALAEELAKKAPVPMALAKQLLGRARHLDSEEAMRLEAHALLQCMETRDWKEGIQAFHEKREPRFHGE